MASSVPDQEDRLGEFASVYESIKVLLDKRDTIITSLNEQITEKDTLMKELKSQISAQETQIRSWEEETSSLTQKNKSLTERLESLRDDCKTTTREKLRLHDDLDEAKRSLEAAETGCKNHSEVIKEQVARLREKDEKIGLLERLWESRPGDESSQLQPLKCEVPRRVSTSDHQTQTSDIVEASEQIVRGSSQPDHQEKIAMPEEAQTMNADWMELCRQQLTELSFKPRDWQRFIQRNQIHSRNQKSDMLKLSVVKIHINLEAGKYKSFSEFMSTLMRSISDAMRDSNTTSARLRKALEFHFILFFRLDRAGLIQIRDPEPGTQSLNDRNEMTALVSEARGASCMRKPAQLDDSNDTDSVADEYGASEDLEELKQEGRIDSVQPGSPTSTTTLDNDSGIDWTPTSPVTTTDKVCADSPSAIVRYLRLPPKEYSRITCLFRDLELLYPKLSHASEHYAQFADKLIFKHKTVESKVWHQNPVGKPSLSDIRQSLENGAYPVFGDAYNDVKTLNERCTGVLFKLQALDALQDLDLMLHSLEAHRYKTEHEQVVSETEDESELSPHVRKRRSCKVHDDESEAKRPRAASQA